MVLRVLRGKTLLGYSRKDGGRPEERPHSAGLPRIMLAVTLALLTLSTAKAASPLDGLWLTRDHDGVMQVSSCGNALCVEIVGMIMDHRSDPAPLDYRGEPQCHLRLVDDARPAGPNLWRGHILDPRNGSTYGVELLREPSGNLALRGYLGFSLFGQTQTWTRYPGTVPADCRLYANPAE